MRPEESRPHCLTYDSTHRRIVTAMSKPYAWVHKMVAQVGRHAGASERGEGGPGAWGVGFVV